jgi:transposase, IS5 family
MQHRVAQRVRTVTDATRRRVGRAQGQLKTMIPLLRRVVAHTTQRVFEGDTHVPDKVVSLFEPHATPIRKGKIVTPTELGRLVSIQEADGQIVAAYAVHDGRPADSTLEPLDAHEQTFRKPPDLAVADRGFASAANEAAATARGVRRVVLPRPGPKTPARRAHERQRRFRRGLRWRVGCDGRISVLTRRHRLRRCLYPDADGMERWVGLGVLAGNLVVIATPRGAP